MNEKKIWQNPILCHLKAFNKLGIKEIFFNLIKDIYEKSVATIKLHGERLNTLYDQEPDKDVTLATYT